MQSRERRGPTNQVLAIRRFRELARAMEPVFASSGFVPAEAPLHGGQASRWYATDADSTRSVQLWRSRYWGRTSGTFTVPLEVRLPAVDRVLGRDASVLSCTTGHELGSLVRPGGMVWTLDEHTDVGALAQELGALWVSHGLPWLERNRTAAGACAWLVEVRGHASTAFCLGAGDRPAARAALRTELLEYHVNKNYIEHLLAIALRYDLLQASDADPIRAALPQDRDARTAALDRILDARRE